MTDETPFDPAEHDLETVQKHLASAEPEEVERVLELERVGKKRKTLLEKPPTQDPGAVKPSPDGLTRVIVDGYPEAKPLKK